MTAKIYQDMQLLGQKLFTAFNQGEIAYVVDTPGSGPADDPGEPTSVTTVFPGATARGVSFKFLKNSAVLTTDLEIHLPGGIVDIEPEGYMMVDGTPLKIVQIERQPSAGVVVAWTVIARK